MTPTPMPARGLYAITSEALCCKPEQLLPAVEAALRGGVVMLQYRDKWNPPPTRLRLARELLETCRAYRVPLLINDDLSLALEIGADGVHLGADDGPLAEARARLGPDAILGASCGDSLVRAQQARAAGASYVAFGRLFASRTKPQAAPASLSTLTAARALGLPVCAIGGITPDNAAQVIAAGADLVAAIDGIFGAPDIEQAARAYAGAFISADGRIA